jgi:hypothetical protein
VCATRYLLIGEGSFALVPTAASYQREDELARGFCKKHGVVNSENTFRVLRQSEKSSPCFSRGRLKRRRARGYNLDGMRIPVFLRGQPLTGNERGATGLNNLMCVRKHALNGIFTKLSAKQMSL